MKVLLDGHVSVIFPAYLLQTLWKFDRYEGKSDWYERKSDRYELKYQRKSY